MKSVNIWEIGVAQWTKVSKPKQNVTKHTQVKNSFTGPEKPLGFTISTTVHWYGFRFHITSNFQETLVEFWCSIREEYLRLSEKTTRECLPFPST